MTRETAQKLLDNMDMVQAFAEGQMIQTLENGVWKDNMLPVFNLPRYRYRIKPREPREFNACLNKFGELVHESYGKTDPGYTPIRVVEILTDETP